MFRLNLKALLWVFGGGLTLGLLALFTLFAYILFGDPFNTAPRHQDMNNPQFRQAVERRIGIDFPASVRWRGCHMTAWQDTFIQCSFQIPKHDIPKLLPGKRIEWSGQDRRISDVDCQASWFRPNSVSVFKSAEVKHPNENCFMRILYDDSVESSSMTTVYLAWNDM